MHDTLSAEYAKAAIKWMPQNFRESNVLAHLNTTIN